MTSPDVSEGEPQDQADIKPEKTQAERDREVEQRQFPSRGPVEEVKRAWSHLSHRKWVMYKAQFPATLKTVILGIGRDEPFAETTLNPDGSSLIRVYDGLVLYLKSVCRAWLAGANLATSEGKTPASLRPNDVNQLLLETLQQWQARSDLEDVEPPAITLSDSAERRADSLFIMAIVFTIMHEYGHAALHGGQDRDAATQQQELEADEWAVRALLEVFALTTGQVGFALAGALISVRAHAAREVIFKVKLKKYPPSAKRFAALTGVVRTILVDELRFYIETTILGSNDMRMQAAEHALGGDVSLPPGHPEQFTSMIVSQLIEVTHKRRDLAAVVQDIEHVLRSAQPDVVSGTAAICRRIFSKEQPAYRKYDDVGQLLDLFPPLLAQISDRGQTAIAFAKEATP
jgi:hypothetical protein